MMAPASGKFASLARAALLAALVISGSLVTHRPAMAAAEAIAAANTANAGIKACSSNSGKALYDCLANVLDRMSTELARAKAPETQRALNTAASQLRAAVNKTQALSAIAQCRAVVAGVMQQLRAAGEKALGLSAVAATLAQAARLIQSKG